MIIYLRLDRLQEHIQFLIRRREGLVLVYDFHTSYPESGIIHVAYLYLPPHPFATP